MAIKGQLAYVCIRHPKLVHLGSQCMPVSFVCFHVVADRNALRNISRIVSGILPLPLSRHLLGGDCVKSVPPGILPPLHTVSASSPVRLNHTPRLFITLISTISPHNI